MNFTIKQLLDTVVLLGASDLYIMTGASPTLRFRGEISKLNVEPLTSYAVEQMIMALLPDDLKMKFAREKSLEVALNSPGTGRFLVKLLIQQNRISMSVSRLADDPVSNNPALMISNGGQFLPGSVAASLTATRTVFESPTLQFAEGDEKTHAMLPPPSTSSQNDPWQTGMMKKRIDPLKKKKVA